MIVKLSKDQLAVCDDLSKHRWNVCRQNGQKGERLKFDNPGHDDYVGLAGELAVAAYLSDEPNLGDTKIDYDLEIPQGYVDVKSTERQNGNLLAPLRQKKHPTDIYILCTINAPAVDIVGYVLASEFMVDENIRNIGGGDCYFLSREELHPVEELLQ